MLDQTTPNLSSAYSWHAFYGLRICFSFQDFIGKNGTTFMLLPVIYFHAFLSQEGKSIRQFSFVLNKMKSQRIAHKPNTIKKLEGEQEITTINSPIPESVQVSKKTAKLGRIFVCHSYILVYTNSS